MYASEARQITVTVIEENIENFMQDIFKKIKENAALGRSMLYYRIDELPATIDILDINLIDCRLKELGYMTEVFDGSGYLNAGIEIKW